MSQEPASLFVRLAPVLNVSDLAAERAFYEKLGLPVIYEGPEYPDFIAFGTGNVHFGIQRAEAANDPPAVLPGKSGSQTSSAPWNDASRRTSASNLNTTSPRPAGPTGAYSSAPRLALEGANE